MNISISHLGVKSLSEFNDIPNRIIGGSFNCSYNDLSSLEFGPEYVDKNYECGGNQLTSFEFGPKEVGERFDCFYNQLSSLEFCASKIGNSLGVALNKIENLKGIHKQFKNGYIKLGFYVHDNPLKSHVLGVILIPKLQEFTVDNKELQFIIGKHLSERDVLECQEELIQNGFKEFAQL